MWIWTKWCLYFAYMCVGLGKGLWLHHSTCHSSSHCHNEQLTLCQGMTCHRLISYTSRSLCMFLLKSLKGQLADVSRLISVISQSTDKCARYACVVNLISTFDVVLQNQVTHGDITTCASSFILWHLLSYLSGPKVS